MTSLPDGSAMAQDKLDPVNKLVRQAADTVVKYRNLRSWLQAPEGSQGENGLARFDEDMEALERSIKETVAQMDKEVGRGKQ